MFKAIKEWWRQRMFKRIVIELSGPICTCEEQNLAWQPSVLDKDKKPTLELTCETCGTKLVVPNKKFVASFKLDKAYPGKKKVKEEPKTEPRTDNVIPFPSDRITPSPKDSA